jgi:Ca2+-binding RTX toxin-like protein
LATSIALIGGVLISPGADATVACSIDDSIHTMYVEDQGVPIGISASGGELMVNGVDCGAIDSVDTVVADASKSGTVIFTLTNPLGPGLTDEGDGSSELEFQLYNHYGDAPDVQVIGSDGSDHVTVGSNPGIAVNLNAGADGATPDADVTGIGEPAVTLRGNGGDDVFSAAGIGGGGAGPFTGRVIFYDGTGADTLAGGDGPDVFYLQDAVADGGDTVTGGSKPDELHFTGDGAVSASFTFDGVADDGVGCPGAGCDHDNIGPDVERVWGSKTNETFVGADGGNRLLGGGGNDVLTGNGGRDRLDGGFGNDELRGGAGPDWINGGKGADLLSGGKGYDVVLWFDSSGPLFVDLDGKPDDGKAGEGDNAMPDLEKIDGSDRSDTIIGGPGRNDVYGGPGDDVLRGSGGNDQLVGDDGNDTLDGGDGTDHCVQGLGTGTKLSCER